MAGSRLGGQYARVLRTPGVAPLFAVTVLGRIPIGLIGLALVLFLQEQKGSFAVAGGAAAAFAAGAGIAAPLQGRLIDRRGQRRVLLPLAAGNATGLILLIPLGRGDASLVSVFALAFVTGATVPPLSAAMRVLWPRLLGERTAELLPAALALDAVSTELMFVSGPLLVAAITAVFVPEAALALGAVLTLVGTVLFTAHPASRAAGPADRIHDHGLLGALSSVGMRTIVLCTFPAGFCFGSAEVALPAFAHAEGSPNAAGILLAAWSVASAAGGLVYGARSWRMPLSARWPRLMIASGLTFLPLLLAPSILGMALLAVLAGVLIAPLITAGNELIGVVAPQGAMTEAYTWGTMALVAGVAAGNASSGALSQVLGWEVAVGSAAGVGMVAGLLALTREASLRPPVPCAAP